jgi:hypothetical protein
MPRSSIFALVAISTLVACTRSETKTPPPQPPAGHVEMTLTCFPDGTLGFALSPWAVTLPAPTAAFTFVNSHDSNVDATIDAQNPQYPFGGRKISAPHNGAATVEKPVAGTPGGTYKYSVTAVCPSPSGPKTTVVDPDMIIPWKISAS